MAWLSTYRWCCRVVKKSTLLSFKLQQASHSSQVGQGLNIAGELLPIVGKIELVIFVYFADELLQLYRSLDNVGVERFGFLVTEIAQASGEQVKTVVQHEEIQRNFTVAIPGRFHVPVDFSTYRSEIEQKVAGAVKIIGGLLKGFFDAQLQISAALFGATGIFE